MNIPSLRSKALQVSVGAFVSATAIVLTTFVFFSFAKQTFAQKELQSELLKSGLIQVEKIIPSILIQEQRNGLPVLMEQFKKEDALTEFQIFDANLPLPDRFKGCKFKEVNSVCMSTDRKEVGVLMPILESGNVLGYLFKAKSFHTSAAMKDLVNTIKLFAILLLCVFGVIYLLISQLISKTLPTSIDSLIAWVEADLTGKRSDLKHLPFAELEILRGKISEALDRYHRERDQAIIGQLSSGVLHDMKTMIHPIKLGVDLASIAKESGNQDKYLAKCEYIYRLCEEQFPKMNAIIESVMDGNREVKVKIQNRSLLATIQSAAKNTKEMALQKGVRVELPIEDVVLAHDPAQLERALLNLMKNGIESAAEASLQKVVRVNFDQNEQGVSINVEDSGPGLRIDPKKLFKSVSTTKIRGTGLGLIVTKKIVQAHQGEIDVGVSSELKGAKFVMKFKQEVNE